MNFALPVRRALSPKCGHDRRKLPLCGLHRNVVLGAMHLKSGHSTMQTRKDIIRFYIRVNPILSLVAGMSFIVGLEDWKADDSRYWMAVGTVTFCLGLSAYFTRALLNEFS
jgi:hypothetical protein